MGIITFLKKRRKEVLVYRLNKLRKLAKGYKSYINYYNSSIDLIVNKLNNNTSSKTSYFLNPSFSGYSYVESLTEKYDLYNYYCSLYNRVVAKISRLENRLEALN
ncbi:MAG: hypothetical protein HFJ41_06100 [Clostridia bacterium]|nr:hypothetical protein [Clostridia bacterium]